MASPTTTAARALQRCLAGVLVLGLATSVVLHLGAAGRSDPGGRGLTPMAAALPSPTYRTFTLNVAFPLSTRKAIADAKRALTLGDVGGFQEFSQQPDRDALLRMLQRKDWGWYMPLGAGVAIPIVWDRDRFRLIDGHSTQVHGPERNVTPSRYINVVRLREIATGKVFGYVNTHLISGASRDAQLSNMRRIPRLRKHLSMLRDEIESLFASTEHVFVGGDFNVNFLADRRRRNPGLPTDRLGDLVDFDMPLAASWGTRSLLDYGLSVRENGGLARTASRIVPGFHSDHRAIVFDYTVRDLFETGPLFSIPNGTAADRQRTLDRIARAIRGAEAGDSVRLATARLNAPVVEEALLAAQQAGVSVQVVVGSGAASGAEARLAAALGSDRESPSWLVRCEGSCLGGVGQQQANFVLVSRTGGSSELTLVGSSPMTKTSAGRWTDLYRTTDPSVYDGYGTIFERLAADQTDESRQRVVQLGGYRAQLYPVPAKPHRDPVLKALQGVGCRDASGLRTEDGRTNVRAAVQSWSGGRGRAIAERLAKLQTKGCDVAVLAGPQVLGGIRRILARANVPVRRVAAAQNYLVVDGRYGTSAGASYAWVGGPGWNDEALDSDGVTLVVDDDDSVLDYLGGFSQTWQRG